MEKHNGVKRIRINGLFKVLIFISFLFAGLMALGVMTSDTVDGFTIRCAVMCIIALGAGAFLIVMSDKYNRQQNSLKWEDQ